MGRQYNIHLDESDSGLNRERVFSLLAEMTQYTETNAAGFLCADYYQPRLKALREAFKMITVQRVMV